MARPKVEVLYTLHQMEQKKEIQSKLIEGIEKGMFVRVYWVNDNKGD